MDEAYERGDVLKRNGMWYCVRWEDDYDGRLVDNLWVENEYVLSSSSSERTGYPTQKPLALYRRLVRILSNESDLILDPFCGSGTTLVSAELEKRDYIGIDSNLEAIEVAASRLSAIHDSSCTYWIKAPGFEVCSCFEQEVIS